MMQQRCKSNGLKRLHFQPDAKCEEDIRYSQHWLTDTFKIKGLVSISIVIRLALNLLVQALRFNPADSIKAEFSSVLNNRPATNLEMPGHKAGEATTESNAEDF